MQLADSRCSRELPRLHRKFTRKLISLSECGTACMWACDWVQGFPKAKVASSILAGGANREGREHQRKRQPFPSLELVRYGDGRTRYATDRDARRRSETRGVVTGGDENGVRSAVARFRRNPDKLPRRNATERANGHGSDG
jgi:hypothetical protein